MLQTTAGAVTHLGITLVSFLWGAAGGIDSILIGLQASGAYFKSAYISILAWWIVRRRHCLALYRVQVMGDRSVWFEAAYPLGPGCKIFGANSAIKTIIDAVIADL
jgi:hypothetical protein